MRGWALKSRLTITEIDFKYYNTKLVKRFVIKRFTGPLHFQCRESLIQHSPFSSEVSAIFYLSVAKYKFCDTGRPGRGRKKF